MNLQLNLSDLTTWMLMVNDWQIKKIRFWLLVVYPLKYQVTKSLYHHLCLCYKKKINQILLLIDVYCHFLTNSHVTISESLTCNNCSMLKQTLINTGIKYFLVKPLFKLTLVSSSTSNAHTCNSGS